MENNKINQKNPKAEFIMLVLNKSIQSELNIIERCRLLKIDLEERKIADIDSLIINVKLPDTNRSWDKLINNNKDISIINRHMLHNDIDPSIIEKVL